MAFTFHAAFNILCPIIDVNLNIFSDLTSHVRRCLFFLWRHLVIAIDLHNESLYDIKSVLNHEVKATIGEVEKYSLISQIKEANNLTKWSSPRTAAPFQWVFVSLCFVVVWCSLWSDLVESSNNLRSKAINRSFLGHLKFWNLSCSSSPSYVTWYSHEPFHST